jgi:plastocyanin
MTVKQNFKIRAGIRMLLTSGLVMLAILLIAFSISCQATPPTEEEAASTSTEIEISGFAFVPATITVPVGTTVTWTHNDSPLHTVSSRDALFDSGNLSRGATFSYAFEQSGTFEYYCKIHPYMTGKIIVE